MAFEKTRRAVLAAVLGGGTGYLAVSSASSIPGRFAPGSGTVWGTADDDLPDRVESPHGAATVRFEGGVPHVSAGDERALYYAVGYVQAAQRLFQMDLLRRRMGGRLAAAVGDVATESDVFHRKLQFRRAAEATWSELEGSETGAILESFAGGVERYRRDRGRPLECRLLEYDPLEWTPVATLLMQKQIAWGLTGSFRTLRKAAVRDALGTEAAQQLYPRRLDHDAPILREQSAGSATARTAKGPDAAEDPGDATTPDPRLVEWLSNFEWPREVGSNSWVVGGEHTRSGEPILANDPHLPLTAPPIWFEQRTVLEGEYDARGVTFPGVPLVVIGANQDGAWGFTNAGVDVVDFYAYDREGETYVYGDGNREFETRTETVGVADGQDREVTVRTSVHGPVVGVGSGGESLPAVEKPVGVAWTGFSATRTTEAVHDLVRSTGLEEARAAIRTFDEPTQNAVYADGERTMYYLTGTIPVRRTDGEPVRGTRVFDGSAREGEWAGYQPFGTSDWAGEGFVDFEDKPHAIDPGYVGTANQRIVDDPPQYLSEGYAPPFRGERIYQRLDRRIQSDDPVDPGFVRDLQRDVRDLRADLFVPAIESARDLVSEDARQAVDAVLDWDRRMRPDSRGALLFRYWLDAFREETFEDRFQEAGLDRIPYPNDWVLGNLPPDSQWFAPDGESAGDRAAVAARAMELAVRRARAAGHEVYGDYNVTDVDHPFDQPFLNYPTVATAGSPGTIRNYRKESQVGSSWRMVCPMAGEYEAVLPGGNSGRYFSEHYDDQFRAWVDGEYRAMGLASPADPERVIRFEEGSQ